jgi:hypothetical protein
MRVNSRHRVPLSIACEHSSGCVSRVDVDGLGSRWPNEPALALALPDVAGGFGARFTADAAGHRARQQCRVCGQVSSGRSWTRTRDQTPNTDRVVSCLADHMTPEPVEPPRLGAIKNETPARAREPSPPQRDPGAYPMLVVFEGADRDIGWFQLVRVVRPVSRPVFVIWTG